jgi:predicted transcriptional regulator
MAEKVILSVRAEPEIVKEIDALVKAFNKDRSYVIDLLLRTALKDSLPAHMRPVDWKE